MRQPLLTLLCLLLLCGRGQPQSPGMGDFTRYTRAEGLSNNDVTGIVQDSLGYIWVATGKGLNRFDGRFFTSFYTGSADIPLPSNTIMRLKMQGREIIGSTSAGAFSYHTGTRRFKRLVIPSDSLIYFWENTVYEASRDRRGGYVLSTKTGLYAFDSLGRIISRYDHYHPGDAGRVELWFGGDLFELDDGRILQENDLLFSAYDPVTNSIDTAYAKDHPALGRATTGTGGDLRACFPGRSGEAFIYNSDKNVLNRFDFHTERMTGLPLPFDGRKEITDDDSRLFILDDSLLAITSGVGGFYLLSFDVETGRLSLRGGKYFDGKQCSVVFRDHEGRLWVGTNEGLYKENLSNPMYSAYDLVAEAGEQELKNCNIRAIYADDRDLFVGLRNKGGILVLDKASRRPKRRILLDNRDSVCNDISLFWPYDRDTLWIGTRRGLFWLDRNTYTSGRVAVPPELTRLREHNGLCFLEDRHRNIWMSFGGLNSVVRYDRATRQFTEISSRENPLMRITFCFSMVEDRDGNIWLGGDGICRWNPRKQAVDTLIPYPRVGHALRNFMTLLGCDEQNNLWLASPDNGILRFNCTTGRMTLQKEDNDLTDGSILGNSGIIRDTVWLAMENGVLAFNIRDNSVHLFPYADGLPTLAVTSISKGFYFDEGTHTFYFGSRRHLIAFRPDASHFTDKAPSFFIDRISTAQGPLPDNPNHIELGYANSSLSVDFNAINFTYPEGNRFAYQLIPGADSTWHLLNWQRTLNFYNLAPGTYHVRLKLFSDNNRWPEQYKDLEVVVHPPFWNRGWFIVAIIAAVLLVITGIYRIRIRRIAEKLNLDKQIAEFEMKALHAQMNPHFIFNALNSIREMILHDDNRNASRYLSRFARLIRLNLEHSRQTFITLQQNVEYLESYLEMEQLRFADFSFRIMVSPQLDQDEIRLAPMLIQPLVENAIWHGLLPKDLDKWVEIRFFTIDDKLVCEIEDNGIGIRRSLQNKTPGRQMHRSMGIANIRERIAVLNEKYHIRCSLTIVDKSDVAGSSGSGTLITLVFPVQEEEFVS